VAGRHRGVVQDRLTIRERGSRTRMSNESATRSPNRHSWTHAWRKHRKPWGGAGAIARRANSGRMIDGTPQAAERPQVLAPGVSPGFRHQTDAKPRRGDRMARHHDLSPLRGSNSLLAGDPGARAPGSNLSPLRGWSPPLLQPVADQGIIRRAWGRSSVGRAQRSQC
jgi:hypothetical protein